MSEVLRRDFDEERRERYEQRYTFRVGGEEFAYKVGLRPETFNEYTADYDTVTVLMPGEEILRIYDETLLRFLTEEDAPERWAALREREEEALTFRDIWGILQFIFEEQTGGRPTQAPESSDNGRKKTGASSTARSSSRRAASAVSAA